MITNRKISVVAPVYNEETVIEEFYKRLRPELEGITGHFEILLVDDGSSDTTLEKLRAIAKADARVKVLSLARNFGHPIAISAGIENASGDAVIVMDSDLQDPPEVLKDFVVKWLAGNEVVYGIRKKRQEWLGKRVAYWLFYRLLKQLSPLDIPLDSGDFSLIDRKVVDIMNTIPERNRFVRGLRAWIGFKQVGVKFDRALRFAGKPKYTFQKLLKLATDGLFSFSYLPLKLATILGFIVASVAFVAILWFLYLKIFSSISLPAGFTTTIILILFLGGIQLIAIGILGEYIGRIYEETKQRPLYVVKEKIGW